MKQLLDNHRAITRYAASRGCPDPEEAASRAIEQALNMTLPDNQTDTDRLIMTIGKRRTMDYFRQISKVTPMEHLPEQPHADTYPSERTEIPPFHELLSPKLTDRERHIMELRYIEEKSYREIAELFDATETSIRVAVHRAVTKTRRCILAA